MIKFGVAASESSTLWDATGFVISIKVCDARIGPTRCTPVALGFKGSERGQKGWSKLGPTAKSGQNIASGRQSLGMRPLKR